MACFFFAADTFLLLTRINKKKSYFMQIFHLQPALLVSNLWWESLSDEIRGNFRFFCWHSLRSEATLRMLIKVIKTQELYSSDLKSSSQDRHAGINQWEAKLNDFFENFQYAAKIIMILQIFFFSNGFFSQKNSSWALWHYFYASEWIQSSKHVSNGWGKLKSTY